MAEDEVELLLLLTCRTECSGWARDDSMGSVRRNCCQVTVSLSWGSMMDGRVKVE